MAEHDWRAQLTRKADEAGFLDVRIARADLPPEYGDRLRQWIALGLHGEMDYMPRTADLRAQGAEAVLPGANSVIVFTASYYNERGTNATQTGHGRVARYAMGRDYHLVFRELLEPIAQWLAEQMPGHQWRVVTDSAPLNERAYAMESGIGFMGRNTMVISPRRGSFFLLAEIVTTAQLPPDPPITGTCGTCTRCITACPTGALDTPFRVDATRCISYLTIEKKSPLTTEEHRDAGEWLFGCDICQDVCPYNKAPEPNRIPDFREGVRVSRSQPLEEILQPASNSEFEKRFDESPLLRPGRRRMRIRAEHIKAAAATGERTDIVDEVDTVD